MAVKKGKKRRPLSKLKWTHIYPWNWSPSGSWCPLPLEGQTLLLGGSRMIEGKGHQIRRPGLGLLGSISAMTWNKTLNHSVHQVKWEVGLGDFYYCLMQGEATALLSDLACHSTSAMLDSLYLSLIWLPSCYPLWAAYLASSTLPSISLPKSESSLQGQFVLLQTFSSYLGS